MRKQRFKVFTVVVLIVLIPARGLSFFSSEQSTGPAASLPELKSNVSRKMEKADTLRFKFNQETLMGGSTGTVSAEVYFRRPENLILKYTEPDVQEIYISSAAVYTYIPSIAQATSQKRKTGEIATIAGVTLSVIFGREPFKYLEENFKLEAYELGDFIKLDGYPKSQATYEKISIYFSKTDYYPVITTVSAQNFKSVTTFSNYRKNREFKKDFFKFNPGSEVNLIKID
ncbi:MAG: outer-membrane lipoprotein carrier protein LolA [Elusimicrobiota bacterium]|nr:outer-membrane lipoprotein carrier protein LolA [Elusimicrobiota bacterium]